MNKEKILRLMNRLENTLAQLKTELKFREASVKDNSRKSKKRKDSGKKINLETPIRNLFNEGFFNDWKKDIEVIQKLKEKILTPRTLRRSSVTNVLRRFFDKGLLERKKITEGKKEIFAFKRKVGRKL